MVWGLGFPLQQECAASFLDLLAGEAVLEPLLPMSSSALRTLAGAALPEIRLFCVFDVVCPRGSRSLRPLLDAKCARPARSHAEGDTPCKVSVVLPPAPAVS